MNKKWMALFVILILALSMLSGCSPTEKEYYKLMMEASSQKIFEETGSIEINVAQLPEDIFEGDEVFTKELVQKALNQHRIDYWGKTDLNQGLIQYDFAIVDNTTGKKDGLLSIVYRNDVLYIKVDELISYCKNFCNAEQKQELDKIFGDTEYVSISSQDLQSMVASDNPEVFKGNLIEKSIQQQMIGRRLLDTLVNNVYDKYDSNLISKSDNKYILTLRGSELIDVMKPAAVYTINNMDKLGEALKTFFNDLSEEEINNPGFSSELNKELSSSIDQMVFAVNQNRAEYLSGIEEMAPDAQKELAKTFKDSELVSTIEKVDARTYNNTCRVRIHSTIEAPAQELDFTLNIKETIKTGIDVRVLAPAGKVTKIKEIEKRMPITMIVWVDDEFYSLDKGFNSTGGFINASLRNNQTYVPLRLVAESMGETVGWDETARQAFVERNGQRLIMTGIIVDNETLIKSRDMEKLGYKVSWNDSERTVTIEK